MGVLYFSAAVLLCTVGVALSYRNREHMMGNNFYGFPGEEAKAQSQSSLQIDTPYRLLHHHCDDRLSLNPRIRYFLKMPQQGDDRWGVSTCSSCESTTIHFSSWTHGGTIRSGDRVMVVAPNDVILRCDSSKCPKRYGSYEFTIYKCGGQVGDAIEDKEIVMLYTTHNGKQCQVSFNRADPYLWCPGTPLHTPPTSDECYNSCGTGVYVLPK